MMVTERKMGWYKKNTDLHTHTFSNLFMFGSKKYWLGIFFFECLKSREIIEQSQKIKWIEGFIRMKDKRMNHLKEWLRFHSNQYIFFIIFIFLMKDSLKCLSFPPSIRRQFKIWNCLVSKHMEEKNGYALLALVCYVASKEERILFCRFCGMGQNDFYLI